VKPHTHPCPACKSSWDCDREACRADSEAPDKAFCDPCFQIELMKLKAGFYRRDDFQTLSFTLPLNPISTLPEPET